MGEEEAVKPAMDSIVERIADGKVFRALHEINAGSTGTWMMEGLAQDGTGERVLLSPESLHGNAAAFKPKDAPG